MWGFHICKGSRGFSWNWPDSHAVDDPVPRPIAKSDDITVLCPAQFGMDGSDAFPALSRFSMRSIGIGKQFAEFARVYWVMATQDIVLQRFTAIQGNPPPGGLQLVR
jgi:hypothetical protein